MNLKSKKGITMLSLVIYISSFLVVAGIVAGITIFFYNNTSLLDAEIYSSAEYNKLNMYLVKESEQLGNRYVSLDTSSNLHSLNFSNGDRFTYDTQNKILYFNKIFLCEDVQGFKVTTDYTKGNEVVNVKVDFTNKSYTTKYTMNR